MRSGPRFFYPIARTAALAALLAGFAVAAGGLSSLKVYPNPWRPGSGGAFDSPGIFFQNLAPDAVIKIFTLSGDRVRRLEASAADNHQRIWDGTNDQGAPVASGIYLYLVTDSSGEDRRGRIAVIR